MAGTGRRKSGGHGTTAGAGAGAGQGEAPPRTGRAGRGGAGPAAAGEPRNGRSRERASARAAAASSLEEPVAGGHAMIDLEFLRGLIGAVDASGIDSIEITRAGTRIRISKTPPPAPAGVSVQGMPAVMSAPPLQQPASAAPAPAEEPSVRTDLLEIKSPMVGTFYRSPAPEAPSYVEVGSQVTKGQTLCILEAMKLMNELESEVEGIVRAVLVENAEPVEFGQVLFRVEPTER